MDYLKRCEEVNFYRLLLRVYPVRFREEYEREMLLHYAEERAAAGSEWQFWIRLLTDLLSTVPALLLQEALQDLKHSWRVHVRRPSASVSALVALALGIGACTGVFSVLNNLLWSRLPFDTPERIGVIRPFQVMETPGALRQWLSANRYLSEAAVYCSSEVTLTGTDRAIRLRLSETTGGFFRVFRSEASWGRTFLPEEEQPGRGDAVVISHALWQQHFGGDPQVLGRTIRLNSAPFRVVGVAAPGFEYPGRAQVWTPTMFDLERVPKETAFFFEAVGRLKDGLTWPQAMAIHAATHSHLRPKRVGQFERAVSTLQPIRLRLAGDARKGSYMLLGVTLCVLLIACGNVANLQLARLLDRGPELSIRTALGASRARLLQQLSVESMAMSLVGGLCGVVLSSRVGEAITSLQPMPAQPRTDWRVLGFAIGLSGLAGLLCGVLPAWHILGRDQGHRRRGSTSGLRHALTAIQLGASLILLAGAFVLGRHLFALLQVNPGFETARLLTARVATVGTSIEDEARRLAYYREALSRLEARPEVEAAAAVDALPLSSQPVGLTGVILSTGVESPPVLPVRVSAGYFAVMRIGAVAGRLLRPEDTRGTEPVAVVSEEFSRLMGGTSAVLQRQAQLGKGTTPRTIVGVARSVLHFGPDSQPLPQIYIPIEQSPPANITFVARVRGEKPEAAAATLNSVLNGLNSQVPVVDVLTMDRLLAERLAQPRIYTSLMVACAFFAGLIALLGIHANTSYSLARRSKELGIRLALGATAGHLRWLMIRSALAPAAVAVAVATMVVSGSNRLFAHVIHGLRPLNAMETAVTAAALLAAAAISALCATFRWKTSPAQTLRAE